MLHIVVELIEAVRLVVGSYTGEGADVAYLPTAFWNPLIDLGASFRALVDGVFA